MLSINQLFSNHEKVTSFHAVGAVWCMMEDQSTSMFDFWHQHLSIHAGGCHMISRAQLMLAAVASLVTTV